MTFTVEDGTGVAGANSYESVTDFETYHTDRGSDTSSYTAGQIQAALVQATDYIDRRWRDRFLGRPLYSTVLYARSVLTLTGLPLADETVTVGSDVFTFKASAATTGEVDIATTPLDCLSNLAGEMSLVSDIYYSSVLADPDVAAMTIQVTGNAYATTETLTNGSFSATTTSGASNLGQRLAFPRTGFGLPRNVRQATAEYALRALVSDLAPDPTVHESGLTPTQIRKKVDVVEREYRFAEGATPTLFRPYPAADALLGPYVRDGGRVIRS